MILVQVPSGTQACQIEFPEYTLDKRGRPLLDAKKQPVPFGERSCKGALHLKPGTKTITEAELAFIKKEYPGMRLHVIKEGIGASGAAPKETVAKVKSPDEAKAGDGPRSKSAKGKTGGAGSQ